MQNLSHLKVQHKFFSYIIILAIICTNCSTDKKCSYVFCNCEEIDETGFSGEVNGSRFLNIEFSNYNVRSNIYSRTGDHCIKITKENPYGMTYIIENVMPKEHFRISCWRHISSTNESCIIVSSDDINSLYVAQKKPSKIMQDWELLEMDVIIPQKAKGKNVQVFVFTPNDTAYFDDLLISCFDDFVPFVSNDTGSFIDSRDKHRYKTVKIGDDWWMAENLQYKDCVTCSGYENKIQYENKYGVLYNYDEALTVAPEGWRLPTDEDWSRLEYSLGIENSELFYTGERGNNITYHLKEYGRSGFNVLLAGCYGGGFYDLNRAAYFWTSTEIDSLNAYCREISQWSSIGRFKDLKSMRFSVRCIKNE